MRGEEAGQRCLLDPSATPVARTRVGSGRSTTGEEGRKEGIGMEGTGVS